MLIKQNEKKGNNWPFTCFYAFFILIGKTTNQNKLTGGEDNAIKSDLKILFFFKFWKVSLVKEKRNQFSKI